MYVCAVLRAPRSRVSVRWALGSVKPADEYLGTARARLPVALSSRNAAPDDLAPPLPLHAPPMSFDALPLSSHASPVSCGATELDFVTAEAAGAPAKLLLTYL